MASGKVSQWNRQTGFIIDDADGVRVFFGDRSLRDIAAGEVETGMLVEFDRGQGDRGPRANNVGRKRTAAARREVVIEQHAPTTWVLPRTTQEVIGRVNLQDRHPLIQLDRLSIPGDQVAQKKAIEDVTNTAKDSSLLQQLIARRTMLLTGNKTVMPCENWAQETSSPLTLHLSRSNALENAGLALHPVYGFAYLPGSGLKGMARSAATLNGLDPNRIIEIFGNEPGEAREEMQLAGAVCFHDA